MSNFIKRLATGAFLVLGFTLLYFYHPAWMLSAALSAVLFIALIVEWPKLGYPYLAPIYPAIPFALLIHLNAVPEYRPLFLFIFAFSFIFDSASYAVGTLFGYHKIIPQVSPGKSWEGFIGGTIGATIFSFYYFFFFGLNNSPLFFIPFSLAASCLALLGDLFISFLKRRVDLKDSGVLLPGHGGILDRFDSILFVGTLVYALKGLLLL